MWADPDPVDAIRLVVDPKRAIVITDPDGPECSDTFEAKGRMPRIIFEQEIVLIREMSDGNG
jgi:hypothetical protein